jgi:hypothetical protein
LDNHADFSELRFQSHRLAFAGINVWRSWLSTQAAYSVSFRRFTDTPSDVSSRNRRDALQDLTLSWIFTPRFLGDWWFARSGTIRVDYDLLLNRSNRSSADLDRNFVSIALELGLLPLTADQIGRLIHPGL